MNIEIDGRKIGLGYPPYLVAELSANHNGSLQRALDSITAAKNAGADAIKLQTYTADTITLDCDNEDFIIKHGPWKGYKLYDLYKEAETPFEWQKELFKHARKIGITCYSTPFDETEVELLDDLTCPAYKIASFEIVDIPLIRYIAQTGKPMIISTGMASFEEIQTAITAANDYGCEELIVLHCVSSYPASIEQSNLLTIKHMQESLNVPIGLSDHSIGSLVATGAVALGACFIEKHFKLDESDVGPDAHFSMTPSEFENLCISTKECWLAMGKVDYDRGVVEKENLIFRRSLYFAKDCYKGNILGLKDIKRVRPGFGMSPIMAEKIIGRTLKKDVAFGSPVKEDDFEEV